MPPIDAYPVRDDPKHWIPEPPQGREYGQGSHPEHPQNYVPRPPYSFPGLRPFMRAVATVQKFDNLELLGKMEATWQAKELQNSFGQLPGVVARVRAQLAPAEAITQHLQHIRDVRDSLAVTIEAIDAAYDESFTQNGLHELLGDNPDGSRRLCNSDDPGEHDHVGAAQDRRAPGRADQPGYAKRRSS